jgi:HK97 family phage prohead protease
MNHLIKPNGDTERRIYTIPGMEVRQADGQPTRLVGYAAVFGELSENLGGFREKIAPGAFAKSLGGDVRALFNHDPNLILGRTKAKTLSLREDQRGLLVEITPPDTQAARDVIESMKRGDVDQMSFGFRTKKDDWEENDKGELIRTLIEVDIFDVSPVVFPAYPTTEIAVRSMDAWKAARAPATVPDYSNERRKLDLLGL